MKRYLFILCFSLLPFLSFSQGRDYSALYFDNGKLRADSSLAISAEQFKIWRFAESNIASWIASELSYPKLADRNGIEGLIIVAFDCYVDEIKNIRVLSGAHSTFIETGIATIQQASPKILRELKFWSNWRNDNSKYKGTYYIPIDFSLIPLRPEIKKKAAIPMMKVAEGGLGYPAH